MPTILGEHAMTLPVGTTAQRPTGAEGYIRKNSTTGYIEFWDPTQSTWIGVGAFNASGGNSVTTSGGFNYHTFTSSGTFTVSSGAKSGTILVGAGGGAPRRCGGAGREAGRHRGGLRHHGRPDGGQGQT